MILNQVYPKGTRQNDTFGQPTILKIFIKKQLCKDFILNHWNKMTKLFI